MKVLRGGGSSIRTCLSREVTIEVSIKGELPRPDGFLTDVCAFKCTCVSAVCLSQGLGQSGR